MTNDRRCLAVICCLIAAPIACGGSDGASPGGLHPDPGATGGQGQPGTGGGTSSSGSGGAGGDTVPPDSGAAGTGGAGGPQTATDAAGGTDGGGSTSAGTGGARADGGVTRADGGSAPSYTCSLILGIQTTHEWFGGFEKVVDSARWELKSQDSAHIEKWADPANAVWSLATESACTQNADKPERIVFMGVNYDYTTVEQFLPKYLAVLNNIKTKYPTVKHVDVMTYTRGPGDKECVGANRSNDSYIKPAQDEAIAMLAAMFPDFVFPAPKWEVQSCADFTLCPHLTGTANALISKTIGAYFLEH